VREIGAALVKLALQPFDAARDLGAVALAT
jgi:hypothetical protein